MVPYGGSSLLQYYHLPVHHSGGQISAILPFFVSSVGLKPRAGNQTQLCSLFIWMADFAGLSPLSSDIVEAADGRHPQKKIFSSAS